MSFKSQIRVSMWFKVTLSLVYVVLCLLCPGHILLVLLGPLKSVLCDNKFKVTDILVVKNVN